MSQKKVKEVRLLLALLISGVMIFTFKESFPKLGSIDVAEALLAGIIVGCISTFLNLASFAKPKKRK